MLSLFVNIISYVNFLYSNCKHCCEFYIITKTKPTDVQDAVNATAAVVADYYSPFDTTKELEVKFEKCDFTNNVYNWRGGRAAVVVGNSIQNSLIFTQCRFADNDMTFNNTNVSICKFVCSCLSLYSIN
jgi:hypothetical protein